MSSTVFYRKWRPQTLAEVVGQEQVIQTLRNALRSGQVAHAYLFCGPRGTGKTSTGRILAKAVNCLNNKGKGEPCNKCDMCMDITAGRALDVIEIDAASTGGVDDIRDLREKVRFAPNKARYKVYIIDEVHMVSKEGFNALLKTLEEPPPYVMFILATTEAHKVLPTILSRCQRFDFRRISQAAAIARLEYICGKEGIKIEPEALSLITRSATGSLRDAENLLEQLSAYYGSNITIEQTRSMLGLSDDIRVKKLAQQIITQNVSAGLTTLNSIVDDALDLNQFNRELVHYLRDILMVKAGLKGEVGLSKEEISEVKKLAKQASVNNIIKAIKLFGRAEISFENYYSLPMELALIECSQPEIKEVKASIPETIDKGHQKPPSVEPAPTKTKTRKTKQLPPEDIEAAAESKPPAGGTAPGELQVKWKRMLDNLPHDVKKGASITLMKHSCVPVAIEDNTVVLEFSYPRLKEKMEETSNKKVAEEIISDFLGQPHHIRCILKKKDNKKEKPKDYLVKAAVEMGAEIISMERENEQ
ncbi:MAG: DNA polymerase III subunit gamma/tau [Dehalococcoidia bacterium]|nr:DNA polymerase III subunit gamma/tau [Dehalococcoidia bacterium]